MKIVYRKTAHFDEAMSSGLMIETIGEIQIVGEQLEVPIFALQKLFRINQKALAKSPALFDFYLWQDPENPNFVQITLENEYSYSQQQGLLERIIDRLAPFEKEIQRITIFRSCEIELDRVEEFLIQLNQGDISENIMENIAKLCWIDSEAYLSKDTITRMIDKLERVLFEEIVNRKIRVNGKAGVLKEMNGEYSRFGFFERGVRKNYVPLSLVQKMGARTIRQLDVL